MLNPILTVALYALGGLLMLAGLALAGRDWRSRGRLSARTQLLFYAGAAGVLVGLQPVRPFRLEVASPYLLPETAETRGSLLEHLRGEGWVVGAAKPATLVDRDHPLQPEILARFTDSPHTGRLRSDPDTPPFVFVGRPASGWSRNPRTTTITFVFIAFVLLLSSARRILRRRP